MTVLSVTAVGLALAVFASGQGSAPIPTPAEIEQEVLENVLRQPLGAGSVADLALPDEFVRRVADRIVCSSFEERYRIVVADSGAPPTGPPSTGGGSAPRSSALAIGAGTIVVGVLGVLGVVAWIVFARRRERASA